MLEVELPPVDLGDDRLDRLHRILRDHGLGGEHLLGKGLHRALRDVGVGVVTVDVGDRNVVEGLRREDLRLARRSRPEGYNAQVQVYLGDTMGELPMLLGSADVAFIGGSLVPVGGHNLLEAAAAGVPAAIGPHVFNFAQITEMMILEGAAVKVADAQALARTIERLTGDGGHVDDLLQETFVAAYRNRIGEDSDETLQLDA